MILKHITRMWLVSTALGMLFIAGCALRSVNISTTKDQPSLPQIEIPSDQPLSFQEIYQRGFTAADRECVALQKELGLFILRLQRELNLKTLRLERFNQVDKDGNLRNHPAQVNESIPQKEKVWMK